MNIFYKNAAIAAAISLIPAILRFRSMLAGLVGCLLLIGAIIYMYKLYADAEPVAERLTLGQGAKFGAVAGVIIGIVASLIAISDIDALRQISIEALEPMQSFMGEEAYDTAVEQIENQTDSEIVLGQIWGIGFQVAIATIIGLIAGAIFKNDKDPDADLLNEIQN